METRETMEEFATLVVARIILNPNALRIKTAEIILQPGVWKSQNKENRKKRKWKTLPTNSAVSATKTEDSGPLEPTCIQHQSTKRHQNSKQQHQEILRSRVGWRFINEGTTFDHESPIEVDFG